MISSGTFNLSNKFKLISLILFSLTLNINTLFHDYALDDIVVLTENKFVKEGIKGIPKILQTDYIAGYSSEANILAGARYRPLSLISFALEYQFFGANPMISHVINIILFTLLILLLYKLFDSHLFPKREDSLVFFTVLLFIAHPVHTEVIANVKSRDEILVFLFSIGAFLLSFRYLETKRPAFLVLSLAAFLLALLTKETALTIILTLPLVIYFFSKNSVSGSIRHTIPYLLVFSAYMLLRYAVVGFAEYPVNDVTNSPYLYASPMEAFATKVFVIIKYISLCIFPLHLSTEYGYNQIPYVGISNAKFIISAIIIFLLILIAIISFKKRSLISFSILFFFATLSIGTNFLFDLGAPMAERILFQPSLAFCLLLALFIIKVREFSRATSTTVLFITLILFSAKTIARNQEWKNNETLFLIDVKTSPNSARINLYACEQYIIKANKSEDLKLRNEFLDKAEEYAKRSLEIHNKFAYTYLRLGLVYFHKGNYTSAADEWMTAYRLEPKNPETIKWTSYLSDVLVGEASKNMYKGNIQEAIIQYEKSIDLNPKNEHAILSLQKILEEKKDSVDRGN
ncbi:MAG: hypothetical protein IPJ66_09970 [Bacteroidetes bacterium]|nr:hypothetical protein [Bacteroidota bacterium]